MFSQAPQYREKMRTRIIAGLSIASLLLLGLPTVATAAPAALAPSVSAVADAPGTVQIVPNQEVIHAGEPASFTVTVVANPTGPTPTGQIWRGSPTSWHSPVQLVNGSAVIPGAWVTAQNTTVHAFYEGDANYLESTGTIPVTIERRVASLNLTAAAVGGGAVRPGEPVKVTATLSGSSSAPSGTVTFTEPNGATHPVTVANGLASWTTTLPHGTHIILARYSGDDDYAPVSDASLQVQVDRIATTTTLTASPSAPTINETVTLRATGLPPTATGTVTFSGLGGTNQTVPVVNGEAIFRLVFVTANLRQVTATYSGDTIYAGSASTLVDINVSKLTPALTLTANTSSAKVGQAVAFTASTASNATGTVTFYNGNSSIGTATIVSGAATLNVQFDTAQNYVINAIYSGNAQYNGAPSNVQPISIGRWATPVGLSLSATELEAGNPLTLTTDLPADATGTVTFSIGGNSVGTASVVGGVITSTATLSVPMNNAGSFVIQALYSGDAKYLPGSSASKGVLVSPSTTTLVLEASQTEVTVDESTLFTVRLPAGATGTVLFFAGTDPLNAVTVVDGIAALPISYGDAGVRSISAKYLGDANHLASESNSIDLSVVKLASTIALTASATSVEVDSDVVLTATVPVSDPGSVEFFSGTTSLGTVSSETGTASITVSFPAAGAQSITARYFDSTRYADASSEALSIEVIQVASTTVLGLSATEITLGDELTLTAQVTAGATGEVEFRVGTTVLGTAAITAGLATLPFTFDSAGTHSITAHSLGNARFAPSDSLAQDVLVNKLVTGVVISSDEVIDLEGELTLTATLDAAATGTVEFFDGADSLGTATISNGTASLDWEFATAGAHTITAVYSGDATFTLATSAGWLVTVNKLVSAVEIDSDSAAVDLGDELVFVVTLDAAATGTVEFFAETVAGPGARAAGAESLGTAPVNAGAAEFGFTFTTAGVRSITAVYSGDDTYAAATSAARDITVNKLVTVIALTPTSLTVETGNEIGFVVDVNAAATGDVEFFDGTTSIGVVPVVDGQAILRTTFADAGAHSVTAVYSGDDTFEPATSAAVGVQVTTPVSAEPGTTPAAPVKPEAPRPLAGTGMADPFGVILLSSGLSVLGLLAAAGALIARRRQL